MRFAVVIGGVSATAMGDTSLKSSDGKSSSGGGKYTPAAARKAAAAYGSAVVFATPLKAMSVH